MILAAVTSTSELARNLQTFVAGVNLAQPSWDLFIILFFLVGAFVYGLSLGRDRLLIALVALYMALTVVGAAPNLEAVNPAQFGLPNVSVFRMVVFLLTFIVIFFLLARSALLRTVAATDAPGRWWQVILFSLLHVGLLISVTLAFLPPEAHQQLAPLTRQLFIGKQIEFFWIAAPILALAFIPHRRQDEHKRF